MSPPFNGGAHHRLGRLEDLEHSSDFIAKNPFQVSFLLVEIESETSGKISVII